MWKYLCASYVTIGMPVSNDDKINLYLKTYNLPEWINILKQGALNNDEHTI